MVCLLTDTEGLIWVEDEGWGSPESSASLTVALGHLESLSLG